MNDLLIKALRCENKSSRPPVWLMRQAGRYMPEYRALRTKYSFLEMIHQPEIAVEVTLLPIQLLKVDAAILFSDILVIPEALGVGLRFDDEIGPIIEKPLNTAKDVAELPHPNIEESLSYVTEAIRLLRPSLDVPLIGFSGAPFTLASYLIEGKSSREMRKTKKWMLQDPKSFHQLLDKITTLIIEYLNLQIQAGVDVIQIFDSWVHVLGHAQFQEFSLFYLKKILEGIRHKNIPTILFCKGSSIFAPQLADIGATAVSIDWNADLSQMRKRIPKNIALQGNLDPDILYAPQDVIKRETNVMLNAMKGQPGYIFNLGHGVLPDLPFDHVKTLVNTVLEFA